MNNHMGSKATADECAHDGRPGLPGAAGLFFVDSRTTADTVGAARSPADLGVPMLQRDVFLDDDTPAERSRPAFAKGIERRPRPRTAVVIGHVQNRGVVDILRAAERTAGEGRRAACAPGRRHGRAGKEGGAVKVLGIESSCDECSAAVVEDGRAILSNIVLSQVDFHRPYYGVVPEIASRKHIEWIRPVVEDALAEAGVPERTSTPSPSPAARAHRLAPRRPLLRQGPCLGAGQAAHRRRPHPRAPLRASPRAGHRLSLHRPPGLGRAHDHRPGGALGPHRGPGHDDRRRLRRGVRQGGQALRHRLSRAAWPSTGWPVEGGNPRAFRFPEPSLHKGDAFYDVSYSGLKTAVIHQSEQFWNGKSEQEPGEHRGLVPEGGHRHPGRPDPCGGR